MPTTAYEMDGNFAANSMNNAASAIASIQGIADYNSAQSAAQAKIQRDWQEKQNAKAMEFNRLEAAKNRDWQQYMSNTAHQREVADLKAAGLNPVLSALNGNGASVGSGATASGVTSSGAKGEVDTSVNAAMVNLLGTIMDNQNKLQLQTMSAVNNLAVAEKYTQTSQIVQSMINENAQFLAKNYPSNSWQAIGSIRNIAADLLSSSSGQSAFSKAKDAVSSAFDAFVEYSSKPGKSGIDHIKENYSGSKLKKYIDSVKQSFKSASGSSVYKYK